MAEGGEFTEWQKLCKFRELFHGRFTSNEAAAILKKHNGHLDESINYVFRGDPREIREMLADDEIWTTIQKKKKSMKTEARNNGGRSVLDKAKHGKIDTDWCQFACEGCDHFWWRRIPDRKKVSKCKMCRERYDPVPRDEQWGWAEFLCPSCGNEFRGHSSMQVPSECYKCGGRVMPSRILPPDVKRQPVRNSRNAHRCDALDCVSGRSHSPAPYGSQWMTATSGYSFPSNRMGGGGSGGHFVPANIAVPVVHQCAHPSGHDLGRKKVLFPSTLHDSTGSTVDTFLPQDVLDDQEFVCPMLPTISETSDGDQSDEHSNSDH